MNILIFTGYIPNIKNIKINPEEYSFVIAADKGYKYAFQLGISPNLIIGDFDTATSPAITEKKNELIILPPEKDMTDTEAALDIAATKKPSSITILGGLGGRFDHTMGNIALLSKYDLPIKIKDEKNSVTLLRPGEYFVAKDDYQYISLVPFTSSVSGLSISGVKYTLKDAELTHDNTLGISNEITETASNASPTCEISFKTGKLLVCQSND